MKKVYISTGTSKMGEMIPSVNVAPIITCRQDCNCRYKCYGCKGRYRFEKVYSKYVDNLEIYKENPESFFEQVAEYLSSGLVAFRYFRWQGVGDIVDDRYFAGMVEVANKCKGTKFLVFTKKFDIINKYLQNNELPSNLKVVFSAWDKSFKVDNPYSLPIAYVCFKSKEENPDIPELAIPCKGRCDKCLACWSLNKGQSVVFDEH